MPDFTDRLNRKHIDTDVSPVNFKQVEAIVEWYLYGDDKDSKPVGFITAQQLKELAIDVIKHQPWW
jgi:hypothetical protein